MSHTQLITTAAFTATTGDETLAKVTYKLGLFADELFNLYSLIQDDDTKEQELINDFSAKLGVSVSELNDCLYSSNVLEDAYDDQDKEAVFSALLSLVDVSGNKVCLCANSEDVTAFYESFLGATLTVLLPLMGDKFATWTNTVIDSQDGTENTTLVVMKDGTTYSLDELVANLPR